jgi:sporulation protein YlmC with PRC-barrel domain
MPAGLGRVLETASPASPERRTYEAPGTTYTAVQRARGDTRSSARWAYWVLPLLALAGLLWYLFAREPETVGPVATSKSPSETIRDVQTKIAYLSSVPDSWVSIGHAPNDYVNKDIYNRAGEQLGTIKDVLVGPDGKMTAAIINVGRYLGIGDKEIAVPFSAIQQQRSDSGQRIVIDATKDNLQAAPIFVTHPSSKQ